MIGFSVARRLFAPAGAEVVRAGRIRRARIDFRR